MLPQPNLTLPNQGSFKDIVSIACILVLKFLFLISGHLKVSLSYLIFVIFSLSARFPHKKGGGQYN